MLTRGVPKCSGALRCRAAIVTGVNIRVEEVVGAHADIR
jgi:hypothetical protein